MTLSFRVTENDQKLFNTPESRCVSNPRWKALFSNNITLRLAFLWISLSRPRKSFSNCGVVCDRLTVIYFCEKKARPWTARTFAFFLFCASPPPPLYSEIILPTHRDGTFWGRQNALPSHRKKPRTQYLLLLMESWQNYIWQGRSVSNYSIIPP